MSTGRNWEKKDNNLLLKSQDEKIEYCSTNLISDNNVPLLTKQLDINDTNYNYILLKFFLVFLLTTSS